MTQDTIIAKDRRSILPGQLWTDTDGNPIEAHGGTMYQEDGVYY